jgi:pyruvate-formate lyase-activating enzyme
MSELTIELTNYCEHGCKFCSSNSVSDPDEAEWITYERVEELLKGKKYDHIILSGGEPLSHQRFYDIYKLCEKHADDVVVYSNLIKHLVYNVHVIDGVYLEAKVTPVAGTKRLSVLKRVEQGAEATRPEVTFSRNYECNGCDCGNKVVKPNGSVSPSPCRKTGE